MGRNALKTVGGRLLAGTTVRVAGRAVRLASLKVGGEALTQIVSASCERAARRAGHRVLATQTVLGTFCAQT